MPIFLTDEIQAALRNFIEQSRPGLDESQAAVFLLREALVQRGHLAAAPECGTPPGDLNAANDD